MLFVDDDYTINPSLKQLADIFQPTKQTDTKVWDCLMVGAGPAALSAAVYTAREDISTLIVEKGVIGGLAAVTDQIDNYPRLC